MTERRSTDEEVAAIFERASESEHSALPVPSESKGMMLAALQEIGREVGISPESISHAALDRAPATPLRPSVFPPFRYLAPQEATFPPRCPMPIYEYHCRSCGHDFQHTEPISEHGQHRTACPKCRSTQVEQVLTPFFAKTARKA